MPVYVSVSTHDTPKDRGRCPCFSDSDDGKQTEVTANGVSDSVTLEEQEALALKLLNSMHS
ncbi:DEAD-box ATP-dependent RNA helicase 32 [Senna tora]|uniref:DEAD-box ATP-dependent RNA helicase 32 n=1 Tax=Senna tora TaxID=362788 RepID=A0A834TLH7_9FABA|nr:DEAD-box ATP-dependent RNA helicase 32 [Senna tora]